MTRSTPFAAAALGFCCLLGSGCVGPKQDTPFIPDIARGSLHYASTDMMLDGGTVVQTYQDAQGGEYTLRFPRKETSLPITWKTPNGDVYSLAVRENQGVITDFLTGTLSRYRKNWIIYEDIRHALLAIRQLPQPPLWNMSSEQLDGLSSDR